MNATQLLAAHRLALGTVALLASRTAGRLYGLDFSAGPGPTLTRLMASRNLALGVGLLMADEKSAPLLHKLNIATDVIDLATVADETRRGALPRKATVIGFLTSLSGAALGAQLVNQDRA